MSTAHDTHQSDIDTPNLTFETNGLYILVSDRGDKSYTFHWRLYLHQCPTGALKIGELDPILHAHFLERLHQVPIVDSVRFRERITCRVWLKEALFALDDEGYIMLTRSVDDIEAEARNLGLRNKSLGRRTVVRSCGSQA
ncbi:hypothetical protein N7519_007957 [Penicillium mononematosum]|uniref:uncharacterized protein n=1 Tax=Penicillium mononematosum TaxID=268346 RepID=UPI0025496094|nr:uncharacterized protein N7519_007957 [Penicillium mononematosum]KAJ6186656.1 hypothetical protein N7519_007957 [Penicillium mononematosum]